jgi:hypothetical protein
MASVGVQAGDGVSPDINYFIMKELQFDMLLDPNATVAMDGLSLGTDWIWCVAGGHMN